MSDRSKVKEYMKTYNSFSGTDMVATMYMPGVDGAEGAITLGSLQTISYSIHMERAPVRSISNINAKSYVMGPRTIAGSLVFAVFDKHFSYEAMKKLKGDNTNFYFLADELPPFDITVTFANEYGQRAKLALYGVRLIDEGQVMSINDILTENTYQFVATDIDLLSDNNSSASGGLIYEDLSPNQPITDPIDIEWVEQLNADLDEAVGEYDYALRAYVSKQPEKINGNGIVELNFYGEIPTEGKIVVHKYNEVGDAAQWIYQSTVICTSQTQYPAQVPFLAGDYKAQYFDINEQIRSKYVEFNIEKQEKEAVVPIPTISSALMDALILNIGEGVEVVLYRQKKAATWITAPVTTNNKLIVLVGLDVGATYEFKARIGTQDSKVGEGTTLEYGGNLIASFKNYLMANKEIMKEYNVSIFQIESVAQKAHVIYSESLKLGLTPPIAVCIKKALKELSPIAMVRTLRAEPEVNERIIEVLAIEAARYENRYAEVKNLDVPCIKVVDDVRGHFLAPLDTKQMVIESEEGAKRIIALSKMKKKEDGYFYEAQLDPGVYEVYSISRTGVRTAKNVFVSTSNDTKKDLISRQRLILKDKAFAVNAAKEEVANYVGNLKEKDNLFAQWSLMKNLTQSDAVQPELIEIKHNVVTVRPVSPINVLPKTLYLCIEDLEKAQDQNTLRKIIVNRLNHYEAVLTIKDNCLMKGRRYALWYQEIETEKKYRPTCFVFDETYDEDDINGTCAKKDRDILLKTLYLLAVKTETTHLLDYLSSIINSVFEDSTQNLEKSINNIVETMYNENILTKKNLCESICLIFTARNTILSRYNNQDLSGFTIKDNLIKARYTTKTAYLKRFVIGKSGITYLDAVTLAPGQSFDSIFYDENNQVTGFYLIESDKEKVGLPTIMDVSGHLFYGRRILNDNE